MKTSRLIVFLGTALIATQFAVAQDDVYYTPNSGGSSNNTTTTTQDYQQQYNQSQPTYDSNNDNGDKKDNAEKCNYGVNLRNYNKKYDNSIMVELRNNGLTFEQMASRVGCYVRTVKRRFEKECTGQDGIWRMKEI